MFDGDFLFKTFCLPLVIPATPPQSKLNASKPRTFIARLFVLLNTAATIGNNSFLMVEKSRTASMVEIVPSDLSTMAWVGDSRLRTMIGSTPVRF